MCHRRRHRVEGPPPLSTPPASSPPAVPPESALSAPLAAASAPLPPHAELPGAHAGGPGAASPPGAAAHPFASPRAASTDVVYEGRSVPGDRTSAFATTKGSSGISNGDDRTSAGQGPGREPVVVAKPGEVSCPRCTFLNPTARRHCEMCDGALPSPVAALPPRATAGASYQTVGGASKGADGAGKPGGALAPVKAFADPAASLSAAAAAVVPSTVLPGMASGGAGGPARASPEPAPPGPSASDATTPPPRVVLQEAARATMSLSPMALGDPSSSSSDDDGEGDESSDEGLWSEDEDGSAAARDTADHRELVRFLETLQSVKFDTLPCAAAPSSMQARADLRPFQLQALSWLLSREQQQPALGRRGSRPDSPSGAPPPNGGKDKSSFFPSAACGDVDDFGKGANARGEKRPWASRTAYKGLDFDAEGWFTTPSAAARLIAGSAAAVDALACAQGGEGGGRGGGDDRDEASRGQDMTRTVRGGVLADYMGLGKTRTLIALCEAARAPRVDRVTGSLVESTATLIVCPTSLLTQWVDEIKRCVERPASAPLRILVYYGARKRRLTLFQVAQSYDYVLTTYQTLCHEQPPASRLAQTEATVRATSTWDATNLNDLFDVPRSPPGADAYDVGRRLQTEVGKLFLIRWGRIILDEAHYIRNMRTHQSRACLKLSGACRWVVTATPVQNSLNDLYPLLRFLEVPHFSSLQWWNDEIVRYYNLDPRHPRPVTALSILFGSILLRRTPDSLVDGQPILRLPPKRVTTHTVALSRDEARFYNAIHSKAAEKLNALRERDAYATRTPLATFTTAFEMLVRCRQTCLHPYIVVAALRRCHRLPNRGTVDAADADAAVAGALNGVGAAAASTPEGRVSAEQRRAEAERRTARAIEEFVTNVVLRRLRAGRASEFVQSLVAEIKAQKLESRECIICLDTVNRPAILRCAHVFCEACITHALQATGRCPLCKHAARESELLLVPVELLATGAAAGVAEGAVQAARGSSSGGGGLVEPVPEVPADVDLSDLANWTLRLSSKTQFLIDTITALPRDDKVVVFSTFLTYLRYAKHSLEAAGVSCALYCGGMTMKQKQTLLARFHDASQPDTPRVLLATTSSCGVGINLTCANHCFLMEPSWNPGTEEQALNRIHRIGQTKPVTVTKLIADGTIEQNISLLCERKRALSGYCFSDEAAAAGVAGGGGGGDGRLRTADLLELFAPEESSESDAEEGADEEESD